MHIVHLISSLDPAAGGPPAVSIRLASAQAAIGHTIEIASHSHVSREEAVRHSLASVPRISAVQLRDIPPMTLLNKTDGLSRLREALAPADMVHFHGFWEPILLAGQRVCSQLGKPYVLAPHGMLYRWSLRRKALKKRVALLLRYRSLLNGALFVHALNNDEADEVRLQCARPIVSIPNGIFPHEIASAPPPGAFRESLPAMKQRRFILFLSRLHPAKGAELLVRAFAQIAGEMPELSLVIAGPDYGAQAAVHQAVAEFQLQDRVFLPGAIYGERKFAAMRDAACFCLPSEHETFSIAITEAMAMGCPVVISDTCHFPEVAEVGAGQVVKRDPGAIAQGLRCILGNPKQGTQMGQAGREVVLERYTWPRIAARCIEAYQQALHQR